MSHSAVAVVRRWFDEVWNHGREDVIHELLAEDGVAHGLVGKDGREIVGPSAFLPFFRAFRSAFPDITIDVEDTIVEGNKVTARCLVRGTHLGDGIGISPTGRGVAFSGIAIVRVDDGKIVEAWNSFDFLNLHEQLGTFVMPR